MLLFKMLLVLLLAGCNPVEDIHLQNDRLKLSFDETNGSLVGFEDLSTSWQLLDGSGVPLSPWLIVLNGFAVQKEIDSRIPSDFSFSKPDLLTLILKWENFGNSDSAGTVAGMAVTVRVTLDEEKSLSYWDITVEGLEERQIEKVHFPRIGGLDDLGNEKLAVPVWMGQLLDQPRQQLATIEDREKKYEWTYPGPLSMQLLSLYNPENTGFYAAANDTLSYRKHFSFTLDSRENLVYEMISFPEQNSDHTSYSPAYEAVIGTFEGDWITAARRYRKWGSRQRWSRESRLKNDVTPDWLDETALWVWNREESNHVLSPAVELREELGLPVSVLWHWWHRGSYDDTFPEYFPPREGKESFMTAVERAKAKGVNAIVYMNQLQWGTSTESFEGENATYYTVKDREGNMRSHVYNIFTGKSLTNMCIGTDFWKNKYASLAQKALNEYGVSGIYMDQACLSRMCYDPNHSHPPGGGNYWTRNSGALTEQIRSGTSQQNPSVLAGEGGLESYLPYLDVFLTLQVSRERYAGIGDWQTIPLFQAVYHQYGITFGSYSSLLSPPYDDKWPAEYAPEDEQHLLDKAYNKQFLMEQARSFVWGMQPTIANYRSFLKIERKEEIDFLKRLARVRYKGLEYLMHGKFVRTPDIEAPVKEVNISRLSIYAGRGDERVTSFEGHYPVIYSQAWEAENGSVAIALASISDEPKQVDFNLNAGKYGLPEVGRILSIDEDREEVLGSYSGENIQVSIEMPPRGVFLIKIMQDDQ